MDGDGSCIAQARHRALDFLTRVQAEHGLPVSARAMDLTQLVVSELVTNARKYAPSPVLMELRISRDLLEIIVWDSDPVLPVARAADAGRVGQHGLEIVLAVAQGFEAQREPVGNASPPASPYPTTGRRRHRTPPPVTAELRQPLTTARPATAYQPGPLVVVPHRPGPDAKVDVRAVECRGPYGS
ncbi:ATP-binding protein [Streptomyces sp. NPDC001500]